MRRDSDIDNNHDDYSDSPLDPKYAIPFILHCRQKVTNQSNESTKISLARAWT